MDKNFNKLALLIVDKAETINHHLNYLYKYNFKKVILFKKKEIKIKKNLISNFNFQIKILNFSSKEFKYDLLKKKIIKNQLKDNFLFLRTSKFINLNLFKLYKTFIKNTKSLVITVKEKNKKLDNTEFFFLKSSMIEKYDFSFINLIKNKNYKINFVNNEYLNLKNKNTYKKINKFFSNIYSNSVILDRDGVINVNKGYVGYKKDFKFQTGAIKSIKYLFNNNINVYVISNQSGIARGYFTHKDVDDLHEYLRNFIIKNEATINKIYISPFHKDGVIKRYKKNSSCRKPGIKLFKILLREWGINDKSRLIMIGDQTSDQKFAENAKIKFSFFKKGNLYNLVSKI